jgi:transcriptional regulator with XRE-family HTH domain
MLINTDYDIKQIREEKGLSQQQFADYIGITREMVGQIERRQKKISKATAILINEFLKKDKKVTENSNHLVPYYDVAVSAGLMLGINGDKIKPDAEISVPGLNDCDLAVNVWGDSMYPKYCSGEIVVCKSVPLDAHLSYVRFGEAYVIICDDGPVVKYIKKGEDEHHLCFESENKHFESYQIQKSRIQKLYLIKGVITRKNF